MEGISAASAAETVWKTGRRASAGRGMGAMASSDQRILLQPADLGAERPGAAAYLHQPGDFLWTGVDEDTECLGACDYALPEQQFDCCIRGKRRGYQRPGDRLEGSAFPPHHKRRVLCILYLGKGL